THLFRVPDLIHRVGIHVQRRTIRPAKAAVEHATRAHLTSGMDKQGFPGQHAKRFRVFDDGQLLPSQFGARVDWTSLPSPQSQNRPNRHGGPTPQSASITTLEETSL